MPKFEPQTTQSDINKEIGIRMGLAKALAACKECEMIGAEECEEKIRQLMQAQNDKINEMSKP